MTDKKANMKFEAGEIIAFSYGAYSDYMIEGLAKALASIDLDILLREWRITENIKKDGMCFIGWLNKRELIEEVRYREAWRDCGDDEYYITEH